jgi:DtxR family transcriptional regulator, Mn-dependent transcriptional regulator
VEDNGSLSPSSENYLEMMLNIQDEEKIIKISDIAKRLKISKASVTQAIGKLKRLGLVIHESYDPVTFTAAGIEAAKKVRGKHRLIKKFLTEVLNIDNKIAEKDACLMEHVLSVTTINKISDFIEKAEKFSDDNYYGESNISSRERKILEAVKIKTLIDIKKGCKGKIVKIGNRSAIKKRLLEMGITNDSEVEITGVAPLGDPIEITVKGYKLTLRKSEAADIFIEEINK